MGKCAIRVGIPVTRTFDLQGSQQLLISLNIPRTETDGKLIRHSLNPIMRKYTSLSLVVKTQLKSSQCQVVTSKLLFIPKAIREHSFSQLKIIDVCLPLEYVYFPWSPSQNTLWLSYQNKCDMKTKIRTRISWTLLDLLNCRQCLEVQKTDLMFGWYGRGFYTTNN